MTVIQRPQPQPRRAPLPAHRPALHLAVGHRVPGLPAHPVPDVVLLQLHLLPRPGGPPKWIGLDNFIQLFDDPRFLTSLYNTAYYAFFAVPLGAPAGISLAMLLNMKVRGMSIWRTIFYLPSITPVVATSLVWLWMFNLPASSTSCCPWSASTGLAGWAVRVEQARADPDEPVGRGRRGGHLPGPLQDVRELVEGIPARRRTCPSKSGTSRCR